MDLLSAVIKGPSLRLERMLLQLGLDGKLSPMLRVRHRQSLIQGVDFLEIIKKSVLDDTQLLIGKFCCRP